MAKAKKSSLFESGRAVELRESLVCYSQPISSLIEGHKSGGVWVFKFTVIDTGNAEAQFAKAKQSFVFNVILKSRRVACSYRCFYVFMSFYLTLRWRGRKDGDIMRWQTSFSCNLFLGREGCHGNRQQGSEMLGCGGRGERGLVLHC